MKHFMPIVTLFGTYALLTTVFIYLIDKYLMPFLLTYLNPNSASFLIAVISSVYFSLSLLYIGYIAVRDRHK